MKRVAKFFRRLLIAFLSLLGLLVVSYLLFVNLYPSFGGEVTEARKEQYASSVNFRDGVFVNEKDVPKDPSFGEMMKIARKFFFTEVANGRPDGPIPVQQPDPLSVANYKGNTRLIWFGHSAFLLQIDGKNILLDPMLGDVPAPHPWLGAGRFSDELPIDIGQLPAIDAILISHDHYDHLDYESIIQLDKEDLQYFVPLGVGVHLEAWGVSADRITEMDWWEESHFEGLTVACTPAQHFSGRNFDDRMHTLWSSWVIQADTVSLYFSGDGGYGPHFTEIGETYGPFDIALLECGQYNKSWPDIHMFPEETAQAGVDLGAKAIMPIHWGGFKLALHSWTDPIKRVKRKAELLGIPLVSPEIGEPIPFDKLPAPNSVWWE